MDPGLTTPAPRRPKILAALLALAALAPPVAQAQLIDPSSAPRGYAARSDDFGERLGDWRRGLDFERIGPAPELTFRPQPEKTQGVQASVQGSQEGAGDQPRKGFRLPLLGDEARKAGYELPPPLGLGGIATYIERDVTIDAIRISIDDGPMRNASRFINLGSESEVTVVLGRFDAFIFPFLDVYALLGWVKNDTVTSGTATVQKPGPSPEEVTFPLLARTHLDGPVGGFGATLAGGYKELFGALDLNWSQTDIGFDDEFRAIVGSLRVGWNGKIEGSPVRLWTGATYWDTASTAKSTVEVEGIGTVSFEADQGPANPWNQIFGGQVTIDKRFDLFLEFGTNYDDMRSFALGLVYRF